MVDTSVWINHLRTGETELERLLANNQVVCHPFVIGELALGTLRQRGATLKDLSKLPAADVARETEVLYLIDSQMMHGLGIGYVDAHLLASVKMNPGVLLWTKDKRLDEVAVKLGLSFNELRVH